MRKATMLLAAIGFGLSIAGSFPAQALSNRTWVSGLGTDSAPCSRAAPCATFAFALSQTNPGGEVNCLDAGAYGTVTITFAVTISCEAGTGGILAATGATPVVINAASSDDVTLRGLDLNSVGTGNSGVQITNAKSVHIENCAIRGARGFMGSAAVTTLSNSSTIFVYITDSILTLNNFGLALFSSGGFKVFSLKNVVITGSTFDGVLALGPGIYVNITESVISGNGGSAVNVSNASSTANVDRTTMANNSVALNASLSGATIRSIGNNVFNNTTAVSIAAGATVATDGQNRSGGNGSTQAPNASVTLF